MKRLKLTRAERRILRELELVRRGSGPWISAKGLALRLELPADGVSRVVSGMVRRGLLERNEPGDVRMTELGGRAIAGR